MELTDNDRQRIEQASLLYSGNHNLSNHLFNGFIKGAEYATIYEREQQRLNAKLDNMEKEETLFKNMYSEELANKVRQIINNIDVNEANFKHISEHRKINGSLHASLYDIIYKYEAERSKLIKEIERLKINNSQESIADLVTIGQLEAECSELRNKVIELEQTIKKIQDKAIELYGNQIELP